MNNYKIIQCLDNLNDFDAEKYNKLSLGVDIDFSDTNILDGQWKTLVGIYKKKLKNFNQIISIHGTAFDVNPGSPDKKVVRLTVQRYQHCIRIAKMLNASFVVFHSQINPWITDLKIQEKKMNRQIDFWHEIVNEIGNNKLTVLVENVYESDPALLSLLIEKINSPKIKICMDVGHILFSSKDTIGNWCKELNKSIKLIHLHWNNGSMDAHQTPGRPFLKTLKPILRKFKLDSVVALEYKIENIEKELKKLKILG